MNNEIKRKCQGCLEIFDRNNLIKITKLKDGSLKINPNNKELGRSLYVCKDENCIKNLIKKKRIKTTLRYSNQEEISKIEEELKEMVNILPS